LKKLVLYIIEPIYYVYSKFIYQGVMKASSPNNYDKTHSVIVLTFLIYLNLLVANRFVNLSIEKNIFKWALLAIGLLIYLAIYKFTFEELKNPKPKVTQSIFCLIYIVVTFSLLFST